MGIIGRQSDTGESLCQAALLPNPDPFGSLLFPSLPAFPMVKLCVWLLASLVLSKVEQAHSTLYTSLITATYLLWITTEDSEK